MYGQRSSFYLSTNHSGSTDKSHIPFFSTRLFTLQLIMSSKWDFLTRERPKLTEQLLQCRENPNSKSHCYSNSLYPSRWHYRPYHASLYATHVYHSSCQNTPTILRDVLVHSPPLHSIHARSLHPRYWLFRA